MNLEICSVILTQLWIILLVHDVTSVELESKRFVSSGGRRCLDTIVSRVIVRSKLECVTVCRRSSDCTATNFDRVTRECELLRRPDDAECSTEPHQNSVYIREESSRLLGFNVDCKKALFV